jgi:hypothetical protein
LLLGLETYHKIFEAVSFNITNDCMVYAKRGGVILRGCLMTLNFLMKCNQEIVPMLILCKGTSSMIGSFFL